MKLFRRAMAIIFIVLVLLFLSFFLLKTIRSTEPVTLSGMIGEALDKLGPFGQNVKTLLRQGKESVEVLTDQSELVPQAQSTAQVQATARPRSSSSSKNSAPKAPKRPKKPH